MNPDDVIKHKPAPILDKQALLVMALLLGAYVAYQALVVAPREREYREKYEAWLATQPDEPQDGQISPVESASEIAPVDSQGQLASGDPVGVEAEDEPGESLVTLETDQHLIQLSSAGASVHSLKLKHLLGSNYHAVLEEGERDDAELTPYEPLHPYSKQVRSLGLRVLGAGIDTANTSRWKHSALAAGGHQYTLDLPTGLRVIKTYTPPAARTEEEEEALPSYHFDLTVTFQNMGREALKLDAYTLYGPAGMEDRERDRMAGLGSTAIIGLEEDGEVEMEYWLTNDGDVQDLDADEDDRPRMKATQDGEIRYYGLGTHYFVSLVIPSGEQRVGEAWAKGLLTEVGQQPTEKQKTEEGGIGTLAVASGVVGGGLIQPGQTLEHKYMIYVGPRQKLLLDNDESPYYGYGLEEVSDFGVFDSFASLLLTLLIGMHAVVGNWGVAVIMLTFLVRGLMLPASIWSQRNMLRMQKLGPEMQKIKEKYQRKDGSMTPEQQRQFSAEQMELMRKHGVNPLGCVGPIFLQMPIFFGLWKAINYSFELRQTPFFAWVTDLSHPDVLFRLPFSLPLIGTDAVSLFPLLMVVTYYLQQRTQPLATDPRQAEQQKMMRWLFPIFGFFLYRFPSGLMLYFITSALWSITEMLTVKKWIQKQEESPKGTPTPAKA